MFSSGKLYKELFIRIIRPARDLRRIHRVARSNFELRFLHCVSDIADEVPSVFLLKVRRHDQIWQRFKECGIHIAHGYGRRIPCFGEGVEHIAYRVYLAISSTSAGDRPTIQPVAFRRLGCQRDTCPTGYRLLRACGDCTTRIAALRLDAYGLYKIRSKGNRRCTNVNS